jgi:hypothetical protein
MIVTDALLYGYTVITGSWILHFGLMMGGVLNLLIYPQS